MPASTLKTQQQALAEMARTYWAESGREPDMVEGSVTRSLFEALGFQVNDLSARFDAAIEEAVPEAIFAAFDFPRDPATQARGGLRFFAPTPSLNPVYIPKGTTAAAPDETEYVTTEDAELPLGGMSVDVPAIAALSGEGGNTPALTVNRLTTGLPGIAAVTNPQPFQGGREAETLAAQIARFLQYLNTLDSSTAQGIVDAALTFRLNGDGIDDVRLVDGNTDPAIEPGRFTVHAYRRGGIDPTLKANLLATINAARAAGTVPTLELVPGTPVDVQALLRVRSIGTQEAARTAIEAYFHDPVTGLTMGDKASYENLITALTNAHPDILEVTLLQPAQDVPCGPFSRLEMGPVTINEQVSA